MNQENTGNVDKDQKIKELKAEIEDLRLKLKNEKEFSEDMKRESIEREKRGENVLAKVNHIKNVLVKEVEVMRVEVGSLRKEMNEMKLELSKKKDEIEKLKNFNFDERETVLQENIKELELMLKNERDFSEDLKSANNMREEKESRTDHELQRVIRIMRETAVRSKMKIIELKNQNKILSKKIEEMENSGGGGKEDALLEKIKDLEIQLANEKGFSEDMKRSLNERELKQDIMRQRAGLKSQLLRQHMVLKQKETQVKSMVEVKTIKNELKEVVLALEHSKKENAELKKYIVEMKGNMEGKEM